MPLQPLARSGPSYPPAPRQDLVEDMFGHPVADPYRWLEDADSLETKGWSEAQDLLYSDALAAWPGRDIFRDRLGKLLGAGAVSPPVWRGDRQFFMRRNGEQEHAVLLTVDPDGTERVLLDPMTLDPSGLTTLDAWQPSKEGALLAYQVSEGGTEESVIRVMAVTTGEIVDGPIDRARYSPIAFLPGGEKYYYVRRLAPEGLPAGEEQFHRRVWLHTVGTDADSDVLIFGDGLVATNYYGVSVSMDGRWLTVTASEGTAPRNDMWLADLSTSAQESPAFRVVQESVDAQSSLHVGRNGLAYVYTDRNAPRGRLCTVDPTTPEFDNWRDLIPEDDVAVLDGFAILDGAELSDAVILVAHTRHGVSELAVHDLATGSRRASVPLPGLGSISGVVERPEGGHEAWFGYTDHVTVSSVFRYDARNDSTDLWAQPPGTAEVPDVVSRQVEYRSGDGTVVRMFVLTSANAGEGWMPTILYGYGGFGAPMTPAYSATILAWVEQGGCYAIANIRGGSEEGEEWHRDGMLGTKQNVFDDFHAAALWLIDNGLTTREQLCINGGSNGGLLVGAALTQWPELFAGVVCSAPLLDMVRYEKFGLGATWNVEYGSADDETEFGWLISYSPYHHVRDSISYPATLFTVFDEDTRVDPLHARKMCAALQHATTGTAPILIRRERDVGHGARSLSRSLDLSADVLSFQAAVSGLAVKA
jgi:prolyl oligopeptidase